MTTLAHDPCGQLASFFSDPAPWETDPSATGFATQDERNAYTAQRDALTAACDLDQKVAPLKRHLNIIGNDDDQLLSDQFDAALIFTSHRIGDDLPSWETMVADLRQAVLMLAGHWYENREAALVGLTAQVLPLGYDDLVLAHRRWVF